MSCNIMGKKDQLLGALRHRWVFLLSAIHLPSQQISEAELSKATTLSETMLYWNLTRGTDCQVGGQHEERVKAELTEKTGFLEVLGKMDCKRERLLGSTTIPCMSRAGWDFFLFSCNSH